MRNAAPGGLDSWRGSNPMKVSPFVRRIALPALGVIIAIAVWEATVRGYRLPAIVLPKPGAVVAEVVGISSPG